MHIIRKKAEKEKDDETVYKLNNLVRHYQEQHNTQKDTNQRAYSCEQFNYQNSHIGQNYWSVKMRAP